MNNTDPSNLSDPFYVWVVLIIGILSVVLGAVAKGTKGFGAWLSSLRRIGEDAKAADLAARDHQIKNLDRDLKAERKARQEDRKYFNTEMERRDKLSREHVAWDWRVYNTLLQAGLLDAKDGGPPPLL